MMQYITANITEVSADVNLVAFGDEAELVAFGDEAELDVQTREWVGYVQQLPSVILQYLRVRLDGRQVRNAVELLRFENRKGLAERWKHVGRE